MTAKVSTYCTSLTAKVKIRRDVEEVEGRDAEQGGHRRRAATEAHRGQHDADQVQHDQVGAIDVGEQQ
jgi:hypothetical protein